MLAVKSFVVMILMSSHFSFSQSRGGLTSLDRLVSFNCTMTSMSGITTVAFDKTDSEDVVGLRNNFVPVKYFMESAGLVGIDRKQTHISFSGGHLATGSYLSMVFEGGIPSGESQKSGTVNLVKMGGSVFAPVVSSTWPLGAVHCKSIVVK